MEKFDSYEPELQVLWTKRLQDDRLKCTYDEIIREYTEVD